MIVKHYTDVKPEEVGGEAKNTTVRWLIAEKEGAPNFHMRLFEVAPGGSTPHHSHDWEHEIFIVEGAGKLVGGEETHVLYPMCFIPESSCSSPGGRFITSRTLETAVSSSCVSCLRSDGRPHRRTCAAGPVPRGDRAVSLHEPYIFTPSLAAVFSMNAFASGYSSSRMCSGSSALGRFMRLILTR